MDQASLLTSLPVLALASYLSFLLACHDGHYCWWRPTLTCRQSLRYSWDDVARILVKDPLRIPPRRHCLMRCLGHAFAILFFYNLVRFLWPQSAWPEVNLSDSQTQFAAAFFTATLALLGVAYTVRAKVQSDNRRRWIDEVRAELAILLGALKDTAQRGKIASLAGEHDAAERDALNRARMRLELLLNPSECDHRTLGLLLRIAYGIHEIPTVDGKIHEELDSRLTALKFHSLADLRFHKGHTADERQRRCDWLIAYIIRISNALLKREWERIKLGR